MKIEVDVTSPRISGDWWQEILNRNEEYVVWLMSDNHLLDGSFMNLENRDLGDVAGVAYPLEPIDNGHQRRLEVTILDTARGRELMQLINEKAIDTNMLSALIVSRFFDKDYVLLSVPLPYAKVE